MFAAWTVIVVLILLVLVPLGLKLWDSAVEHIREPMDEAESGPDDRR